MTRSPAKRASHLQDNLVTLQRMDSGLVAQVQADLGVGLLDEIRSASRLAWIPLEVDVALFEAGLRHSNLELMRSWARLSVSMSIERPLLRPIAQAALRLYEGKPEGLFRWVPRGWPRLFRDCGELRVVVLDARRIEIRVVHAPPPFFRSDYIEAVAGGMEAIFDYTRVQGRVEVVEKDAAGKSIHFLATVIRG